MANKMNGGVKEHLFAYRGVKLIDGVVKMSITKLGKMETACGKRYTGVNMSRFMEHSKDYPHATCQNCLKRFNKLMDESKVLITTV